MTRTTFVDYQAPVINASWLNRVDRMINGQSRGIIYGADYFTEAELAEILARTYATDFTAQIEQMLIDARGKVLVLPAGGIDMTRAWNLAQRGSTCTAIIGQGFDPDMSSGTTIRVRSAADTSVSAGARGWCVDTTGSQNVYLHGINFWGTGANAATKGILFGRDTNAQMQYAQQHHMSWCSVKIDSSPGATSRGSVALYNCRAEQFVDDHCAFYADTPYVVCLNNELGLQSPYGNLAFGSNAPISMACVESRQRTCYAYTSNAVAIYGGISVTAVDDILASAVATQAAISFRSSAAAYLHPQNIQMSGQVEGFPGVAAFETVGMDLWGVKVNYLIASPTAIKPYVETVNGVIFRNCEFDNQAISNQAGHLAFALGASCEMYDTSVKLYPGDTVSMSGCIPQGRGIMYAGSGNAKANLTAGADIASLGSPNAASSYLDDAGMVHCAGVLQSSAAISANTTIATIASFHRPTRTCYGACFLSGTGLVYWTLTSAGALSIGTAISAGALQVDLSGVIYKKEN